MQRINRKKWSVLFSFLLVFSILTAFPYNAEYIGGMEFQRVEAVEFRTVSDFRRDAIDISYSRPKPKAEEFPISDEDIRLIALIAMAEAEAEPELGVRLVIDTILNRVDDPHFPNTVYEVVHQKNQYTCVTNGRIDRCEVREDFVQLVREEVLNRTDSDVIFFRTQRYSDYGVPMYKVCCHYFSKYE